jgi:arsenate reductase
MLTIYHNPRCRKSRETLKIIEESGQMVQVVEYLKMPPSRDDLAKIVKMLGIRPEDLVRKGEKIFKENFKGKDFNDDQWLDVLTEHPKLIERPIVIKDHRAVIGRPPENVKKIM